jgi:hypothetical protein
VNGRNRFLIPTSGAWNGLPLLNRPGFLGGSNL